MSIIVNSYSVKDTETAGFTLAKRLKAGDVVALTGGMGMGKTAFVRGMALAAGTRDEVSSPTFALVHEYEGKIPLCHFDMYRVDGWDDLYSTGFFDYLESGAILAIEWSENIEGAVPETAYRVDIARGEGEDERIITITGGAV